MSFLAKETRRQYIVPSPDSRMKTSRQANHDDENAVLRCDGNGYVTTMPRDKGKGKGRPQMRPLSELTNQSLMIASSSKSDLESIEECDDGGASEIEKHLDRMWTLNGK